MFLTDYLKRSLRYSKSAEVRAAAFSELKQRRDLKRTVWVLRNLTLCGVIAGSIAEMSLTVLGAHDSFLDALPMIVAAGGSAVMWSLAWYAVGGMAGFLFGVPKSGDGNQKVTQPAPAPAPDNSKTAKANPAPATSTPSNSHSQPNTNLEQISDWLTKMIVGIGLVDSYKFPGYWTRVIGVMSGKGNGALHSSSLAGAIVIVFSILGFLLGYFVTRMFLAPAFSRADQAAYQPNPTNSPVPKMAPPVQPGIDPMISPPDSGESGRTFTQALSALDAKEGIVRAPLAPPAEIKSAKKIIKAAPPPSERSPKELVDLARAYVIVTDYASAVQCYGQAITLSPNSPRLHYEMAWAVYNLHPDDWDKAVERSLLKALANIGSAGKTTRQYVYEWTVYFYLYRKQGYEKSIAIGKEYEAIAGVTPTGAFYVNMACAYGQKYSTLLKQITPKVKSYEFVKPVVTPGPVGDEATAVAPLQEARKNAIDAMSKALRATDADWLPRLQQLVDKPTQEEDDLKDLQNDLEVRVLLRLPRTATTSGGSPQNQPSEDTTTEIPPPGKEDKPQPGGQS